MNVKIMFDYLATPFWNAKSGVNLSWNTISENFNISGELFASFAKLTAHYENESIGLEYLNDRLSELAIEFAISNKMVDVSFYDEIQMKTFRIVQTTSVTFEEIPKRSPR